MTEVAIITGAAGCIGRATSARLADRGDVVVLLDVDEPALGRALDELRSEHRRLEPMVCDVTDPERVRACMADVEARIGPIEILVNNAGGNRSTLLEETSVDDWRGDVELNLNASFYTCSAVVPAMRARGRGCIVNVGSVNGLAVFGDPGYSAAKAGLVQLTRQLATEYGPAGIRANVVCPGTVKTRAWAQLLERRPDLFQRLSALCSLGDIATPDDVAAAIAFLSSADARCIHGAVLVIDAGLTAGIPHVMRAFTNNPADSNP